MDLLTSFGGKGPHLKQWLVTLRSAPNALLTEVFWGFPQSLGKCQEICALPPVFLPTPLSPSSSFLHRLTDKTDATDPEQIAYQARNPWVRSKPVGSHHSLYRAEKTTKLLLKRNDKRQVVHFKVFIISSDFLIQVPKANPSSIHNSVVKYHSTYKIVTALPLYLFECRATWRGVEEFATIL